MHRVCLSASLFLAVATVASAQSNADLAQQLSNPVASLISVPLQFNSNSGFDGGAGYQEFLNIQPVVPISLGSDWTMISRTIIPVINQDIGFGHQQGFGNTTQSLFFTPANPGGIIWAVGPVFVIPTATDDLGRDQWGAGVTGLLLKQTGPWSVGVLANQVWSVTNNDELGETSNAFLQPFVSYTTASSTTFGVNTESTYDWNADQWSVPINLTVSQLVPVFGHPVSFTAGARYWADNVEGGAEGWGWRAGVTYLFPK